MGHNDFSQFHDLSPDGWHFGDSLKYHFSPADSVVCGDLTLSIRHSNDYIYSNLFLEVTVSDSLSTRRDTVALTLADDFGRWHGRGIGTDFQVSDTIARNASFRRPVDIAVRHVMRDDILRHIEQVGISFVERSSDD